MYLHTEKDGKDAVFILCGYPWGESLKPSDGNAMWTLQTNLPGASLGRIDPRNREEAWCRLFSCIAASLLVCRDCVLLSLDLNCQ